MIYVVDRNGNLKVYNNGSGGGGISEVQGANGVVVTNGTTLPIVGLGNITPLSVAAVGTVTGSNISGTNTGDQTIILSGDVTGSGTGAFVVTISNNAITTVKILDGAVTSSKIANDTILNADINSAAAIAHSKMAALTASRVMITDASGFASVSAVTITELGYLSGVTSPLQAQIDSKRKLALHGASATVTGVTTNTILTSVQIPASYFVNGEFQVRSLIQRTNTNGSCTYRFYINTSNSLTGATRIAEYISTTLLFNDFKRSYALHSGNMYGINDGFNTINDEISSVQNFFSTTFTLATSYWIIVSVLPSSALDIFTAHTLKVEQ